jgi:thiol:disulfide interchange protein
MKGYMMKHLSQAIKLVSVCLILSFTVTAQKQSRHQSAPRKSRHAKQNPAAKPPAEYVPVLKYDPARNAEQDIKAGVAEAKRTGKRVLLEVGGQWCIWCHIMDEYFEKHPDLLAFREKNFIMVKINFSDENKNEQVLSRYPPVAGYPHLFVLDSDGKLLRSQDTSALEEGRGYNLDKFMAFLKEWAPAT